MSLPVLIAIIVGSCYLIGSIPFGLIFGKINKIDIREHGSGNIGATNVLRTLGKRWGFTCFACDLLKGLLPVLGAKYLTVHYIPDALEYTPAIAIVSTVLGHVYSIFLKFKGGKGIATSAGAIIAIAPYSLLVCLIIWIIIFKSSGYVSLASIIAAIAIPFFSFLENSLKLHAPISNFSIGILFAIAVLVTLKHKSNIKRLMKGTESSFKKKPEAKT
jgi:glycerol-3-phosphate acyltransferase PlsY